MLQENQSGVALTTARLRPTARFVSLCDIYRDLGRGKVYMPIYPTTYVTYCLMKRARSSVHLGVVPHTEKIGGWINFSEPDPPDTCVCKYPSIEHFIYPLIAPDPGPAVGFFLRFPDCLSKRKFHRRTRPRSGVGFSVVDLTPSVVRGERPRCLLW